MKKTITIALLATAFCSYAGTNLPENKTNVTDSSKSEVAGFKNNLVNSNYTGRQVIKMNLSQLAFKSIALQYEYGFHKNMSGALGISFLIPTTLPSAFVSDPGNGIRQTTPTFNGWSITPEFRFYPGTKKEHQAPHGFYLAPFFRYSAYGIGSTFTDDSTGVIVDANVKYSGYTLGLMIGSQWLIGKHFAIDWWILGGGAGSASLKMDATTNVPLSPQEQKQWADDFKSSFQGVPGSSDVTVSTTSHSVSVTQSGLPHYTVRGFGLCLGYYF